MLTTSFLSRFQLISFMFVGITICQPSSTRGLNICFNLWLPTFSSLFSLPGGGRNCGVHELICARRGKAISHPCTCASVSIRVHFLVCLFSVVSFCTHDVHAWPDSTTSLWKHRGFATSEYSAKALELVFILVNFHCSFVCWKCLCMDFWKNITCVCVCVWIMHGISSFGSLQQKKAAVCSWFIQRGGFVSYQTSDV